LPPLFFARGKSIAPRYCLAQIAGRRKPGGVSPSGSTNPLVSYLTMASFHVWLEVLSYAKALFEAITLGADVRQQYQKHRNERDTIAEAERVSQLFSTFTEDEVQAILDRLKACRDRFIKEGSGPARKQCLCNVFKDVIEGNGGRLPRIDDWENMHRQLNCPRQIEGAG